jgi:hypothetical protein
MLFIEALRQQGKRTRETRLQTSEATLFESQKDAPRCLLLGVCGLKLLVYEALSY